jgi:hypothetical protein
MKKIILGLAIITVALVGCEPKEKLAALQYQVDSLNVQLAAHLEVEKNINEVGVLIDSIDASRHALQLKMIEGNSASDYLVRLKNINEYVKRAELMLIAMDQANKKSSKISASTIRGLKADLEKREQEILGLQLQIAQLSDANMVLWLKVNKQDSILLVKDQTITLNKSDIALLEKQSLEAQEKNKIAVANLYFDQASAVELAADRTQFAPRKKKDARMWALDLFRLSQSLGNKEAQGRIEKLEKKLS